MNTQVGGTHYTKMKVQPDYFCLVNKLSCLHMNFLKYLSREKGSELEDLRKNINTVGKMVEMSAYIERNVVWQIAPRAYVELNGINETDAKVIYAVMRGDFKAASGLLSSKLNSMNIIKQREKETAAKMFAQPLNVNDYINTIFRV